MDTSSSSSAGKRPLSRGTHRARAWTLRAALTLLNSRSMRSMRCWVCARYSSILASASAFSPKNVFWRAAMRASSLMRASRSTCSICACTSFVMFEPSSSALVIVRIAASSSKTRAACPAFCCSSDAARARSCSNSASIDVSLGSAPAEGAEGAGGSARDGAAGRGIPLASSSRAISSSLSRSSALIACTRAYRDLAP